MSIQNLNEDLAKEFNLDSTRGALVSEVYSNSPAEKAGIKEGDVIIGVEDTLIEDSSHLRLIIAMSSLDKPVKIELIRDGKKEIFRVELRHAKEETKPRIEEPYDRWGMGLRNNSPKVQESLGLLTKDGVVVVSIAPGTIAARAGIIVGDVILNVNRRVVNSLEDFKKQDKGNNILLRILRGNTPLYVRMSK